MRLIMLAEFSTLRHWEKPQLIFFGDESNFLSVKYFPVSP